MMPSRLEEVYWLSINHWPAAMKSSKTFCLFSLVPALCHASPYSPPPRRLAMAYTPPCSIHTTREMEKLGVSEMLKPP